MFSRSIILAGLIAALSISSGCGKTMLEKNWGRSYESAKSSQIANPEAEENLEPVIGLDGVTAEINVEEYRKGFGEQPGENIYNLRLGTIEGIGESGRK